jgi:hypothetical protein
MAWLKVSFPLPPLKAETRLGSECEGREGVRLAESFFRDFLARDFLGTLALSGARYPIIFRAGTNINYKAEAGE